MNDIIRKRKSVRKYDLTPLDEETMQKIREFVESLKPLYPQIKYKVEITTKTKGLFGIKAPHYFALLSEECDGAYENIGFIGQQLDLYLSSIGIGTCWLGASKPEEKPVGDMQSLICMSFGKPSEPLHREVGDFKRKPLSEISEGSDSRLEAARLSPSGMNAQNWYFVAENGKIHCYRKKANPLFGFWLNSMACIDMGIALCHIAEESENFKFQKQENIPAKKAHVYMGTVS